MQTLTSIRRRAWSERIASLPLSFFLSFFVFFAKATGRNVVSKCVVPCKEVPFGGLNDVPLNFGGKIPQKLKFWGRE